MDGITPVATQIQPVDASKGINTLSGIIGIKQQQQALQTGQYQQQAVQAESEQAQQRNMELQKAQAIAINGAKSGAYDDGEGGLDRQKMANDILKVAPIYGQAQISSLLSQANEVVANKQAHFNLDTGKRKQMGDTFASLAADPSLDNTKVIDSFNELAETMRDPQQRRMLFSMATHLPPNASPDQLRQLMSRWSAAATGEPQAASTTVNTPGGTQGASQNRFTGALTPSGGPIAQPPHQTTNAAGQIVNVTPGGTVSPAPSAPTANPTTAQATVQNVAASGIANRVQQAQAAANNTVQAQDALTRARAILDSPDAPNTGALVDWKRNVTNFLSTVGIDTQGADDTNSLVKNLARYEASRATQAGLGGTDAARELAHNGSPNVSIDNTALKGIVTQSLATEKALAAYANIQAKAKDEETMARNESAFRNIPNLIAGYEYGLARNQAEANEFLRKHGISASEMKRTRQAIKQFEGQ